MTRTILLSSLAVLALTGCSEPAEKPVVAEKLGDYKALGTEPGWAAEIRGEEIAFSNQEGNDFTLGIHQMKKTDTGWVIKGFSDRHNINLYVTSGEKCSDGMSDRSYADTVKVEVSDTGTLNGCGGAVTEGPAGAP